MPEKISASGLLEKLGLKRKKPAEAPAAGGTPPSSELPAAPTAVPALEPASTMAPPEAAAAEIQAPAAGIVVPAVEAPAPVAEDRLPEWLRAGEAAERELWPLAPSAPLPEPEAPVVEEPAVGAPVAPSVELPAPKDTAPEAEKSPEQLAIEQFEEALLSADDTLAKLRVDESLDETQLRAAKAAAAKANSLIRKLPEHYLRVLLASRRLGEQREYTRMSFQEDMGAAIKYFMKAQKG